MTALANRYDFAFFFDVKDGNPNGDPDAGNFPRIDSETGEGLTSDVCLKRKVRNYIQLTRVSVPGYDIFVKSKELSGIETFLNGEIKKMYSEIGIDLNGKTKDGKERKGKAQGGEIEKGRSAMCQKFFDIRTFGAVMSTGPNAGQVRGPVQMTFARSEDPIVIQEHALTVSAARDDEKDYESQVGIQGRKNTVPYALYRSYGFISPALASQSGFSEEDLEVFWEALLNMFDQDRSAARGLMSARKLIIFKHDSKFGNAHSSDLFDLIKVEKKQGVLVPRDFTDYRIELDKSKLPAGVQIIEK